MFNACSNYELAEKAETERDYMERNIPDWLDWERKLLMQEREHFEEKLLDLNRQIDAEIEEMVLQ